MVPKPQYLQNTGEKLLEAGGSAFPGHNASTSATTYSYRTWSHLSPPRRVPAWDQTSELPPPVSTRERRLVSSNPRQCRLDPDEELALLVLIVSCAVVALIFVIAPSYA